MSLRRDFYASLPCVTESMLVALDELVERQEARRYDELMAGFPPVSRKFRILDPKTGKWSWIPDE